MVIATSGSTGEPKGVQLAAGALLHSARASLDRIGARAGERWLCPLPASHVAGLGILTRSLVSGTAPVVAQPLRDEADLPGSGCAYTSLVPTQLRRLLAAGADLTGFATILLGGAAAPAGLLDAARAAGARVVTTYGMSETCGGCVYDGVPLTGVSVRTGTAGRIEITGPVLFSGYRLRPDLTGQAMADGWFVTSEVGVVDAAGCVAVHGRADEMINTGGREGGSRRGRRRAGAVPRGAGGGGDRAAGPGVGGTGDGRGGARGSRSPASPAGAAGRGRAAAAALCGAPGAGAGSGGAAAGLGQTRPRRPARAQPGLTPPGRRDGGRRWHPGW